MPDRISMTLTAREREAVDALTFLGHTATGPLGARTHAVLWWLIVRVRQLDPALDEAITDALAARDTHQVNAAFDALVATIEEANTDA